MSKEILSQIKTTFDKYKIEFWLDCGTLLGAIREGRMIKGDHDIDLGAWREDVPKIIEACKELGYSIHYDEKYDGNLITATNKTKYPVGFWLSYKDHKDTVFKYDYPIHKLGEFCDFLLWNLKLRHSEQKESSLPLPLISLVFKVCSILPSCLREKLIHIIQTIYTKLDAITIEATLPGHYFDSFKTIKFYGEEFKIPAKIEEYLLFRYGASWRIPEALNKRRAGIWLEKSAADVKRFRGNKRLS